MKHILAGIRKFQQEVFPQKKALFEQLTEGQKPYALFITCSDSRIDPALMMQIQPGTLFVLRNAGNIVPPHGVDAGATAAGLEFAVCALHVRHIVVCGHTHCGAVEGLLDPEKVAHLPIVSKWIQHAYPVRKMVEPGQKGAIGDHLLTEAVQRNVLLQLEHLRSYPCVAERQQEGSLELHGWVYQFENGEVHVYQPATDLFVPLSQLDLDSMRD
jgi:carbonic anhydrase